jgi:hypothetical protein
LYQHLLAADNEVVRLVRREIRADDEICWNPDEGHLDIADLGSVDAVLHLGGKNIVSGRWTKKTKMELRASRIRSTALLAQSLVQMEKPPRVFVCASAVGIYGDRGDEQLDEDSALGTGFLSELCREWEAAAIIEETRVVHARFGIVLSVAGGALAKMLLPFKMGLGGRLGTGRQYMSWIALDDAVAALAHIIEHENMRGPVNMVAPEPQRNADFTRELGRILRRPTPFPVPAFALRLALGEMADEALLASQRVEPKKLLAGEFHFAHPQLADALKWALH